MRRLLPLLALCLANQAFADRPIRITIVHSNDMHDHVQPTKIRGANYGGYARQATLIKQIRAQEKNVLLVNAGDMFQGTLYFNVYEGLAEAAYMNAVRYDAMAVGNHEFDMGPATLGRFAGLVTFPLLSANLDVQNEPALNGKIASSAVVKVGGQRVGLVGAVTPELPTISSPGKNVQLKDLTTSVQSAVDALTKQGVNKIVLITHIGYEEDKKLVTRLHDVDVIVGGHSHTPLGTPDLSGWSPARGPYPTLVNDVQNREVPIVQAYEWSKVLGEITLDFDGRGHLKKIVKAQPIVVDEKIPEDLEVKSLVAALEKPILDLQTKEVGTAAVAIPKEANATGESLMANVVADAMLEATEKTGAVAAFVNAGGVRASLEAGPITYGMAIAVQPFGNTLTYLDLTGAELKAALEEGVGTGGELNPSRNSSYRIDRSKPGGERVSEVVVAGQPLDLAKTYRVAFLSFTASGGDAHVVLQNAKGTRGDTGLIDLDALLTYAKAHSPLNPKEEGRIRRN